MPGMGSITWRGSLIQSNSGWLLWWLHATMAPVYLTGRPSLWISGFVAGLLLSFSSSSVHSNFQYVKVCQWVWSPYVGTSLSFLGLMRCVGIVFSSRTLWPVLRKQPRVLTTVWIIWKFPKSPFGQLFNYIYVTHSGHLVSENPPKSLVLSPPLFGGFVYISFL